MTRLWYMGYCTVVSTLSRYVLKHTVVWHTVVAHSRSTQSLHCIYMVSIKKVVQTLWLYEHVARCSLPVTSTPNPCGSKLVSVVTSNRTERAFRSRTICIAMPKML